MCCRFKKSEHMKRNCNFNYDGTKYRDQNNYQRQQSNRQRSEVLNEQSCFERGELQGRHQ